MAEFARIVRTSSPWAGLHLQPSESMWILLLCLLKRSMHLPHGNPERSWRHALPGRPARSFNRFILGTAGEFYAACGSAMEL